MASYLSRLAERVNSDSADPRAQTTPAMTAPDMPEAAPLDPFENVVEEPLTPPESAATVETRPADTPTPTVTEPPSVIAQTISVPEMPAPPSVILQPDDSPIVEPPMPPAEAPPPPDIREQIKLIERWMMSDTAPQPTAPLMPPAPQPMINAAPVSDEDDEVPINAFAMPAPEAPEAITLNALREVLITEAPQIEPPEPLFELQPAETPQVEPHDPAPTISVGDIVVEIVTGGRPAEAQRRAPAPQPRSRPAMPPAPRHGVRSKRGYGIGQS